VLVVMRAQRKVQQSLLTSLSLLDTRTLPRRIGNTADYLKTGEAEARVVQEQEKRDSVRQQAMTESVDSLLLGPVFP
jgi:hypothetical protein